jgi:dihydroorotase
MRLHFANAVLADPLTGEDATGGVIVSNGKIEAAGAGLRNASVADARRIDCGGKILAPGLIDLRVFTGEPGSEHRETIASAGEAAAAGGVTTMVLMPDTDPPLDDPALVEFVGRAPCKVNVRVMAALTKGLAGETMSEMALLSDAGAVGFTDANRTHANTRIMRRALAYAATFDLLVSLHCEDPFLSAGGAMNESELSARLGLPGIPEAAETMIVRRDLQLAAMTGVRLHIGQVSSAASVAAIAAAKAQGLPVTCAVSAAHLALNENDIGTYYTFRKLSPPLRSEETRLALREAVRDGTIDAVVSSHDPQAPDTKRQPFAQAAFGAAGLETLLPVLLQAHHAEELTVARALAPATAGPARILRFVDGRGTLSPGAPADLILIDAGRPVTIRRGKLRSRAKNTPFEGMSFQGAVAATYVAGTRVFGEDGA